MESSGGGQLLGVAFGVSDPTRGLVDSAIIGRQNGGIEATVSRANRRANRRGRGVRSAADGQAISRYHTNYFVTLFGKKNHSEADH